jgi:predicted small secreted protein
MITRPSLPVPGSRFHLAIPALLVMATGLCACGTTIGTGNPVATTPTAIARGPDLDLHIIDVNPTMLKSSGDHQTDSPENVESRYYWSALPEWGPIKKYEPKPYEHAPTKWGRATTNTPITAIYRVTTAKRFFFKTGERKICYVNTLGLSQDTTTDADADPGALTENRIVGAFSDKDLTESPKVEVSCAGFDKLQNIDHARTP